MPSRQDNSFQVLDVVALTTDLPEWGLLRGQIGTVVESHSGTVFEIEFSDEEGRTLAQLALLPSQLKPVLTNRS